MWCSRILLFISCIVEVNGLLTFSSPYRKQHESIKNIYSQCRSAAQNEIIDEDYFDFPSQGDESIKIGGRDMISHVSLLDRSLKRLTGRGLYERMKVQPSSPKGIYNTVCLNERFVLISHGTEANPIYNFGNVAALQAFMRSWHDLMIPSAESVVLRSQDETLRNELMQKVTDHGFVEGASGIRVRGDGKFIKLVDAVVWNCYDDDNSTYIGQAAFFDRKNCPILDKPELA